MVEVVFRKVLGIRVRSGYQPCFFFIIEGVEESSVDRFPPPNVMNSV
jgi:hypothetical protein